MDVTRIEKEYFTEIETIFAKILGIKNLRLKNETDESKHPIVTINGQNFIATANNKQLIQFMKKIVNENFQRYVQAKNTLEKKYVKQALVDQFIYSIVLKNQFLDETIVPVKIEQSIQQFFCFLEFVKNISSKTYEQRLCTASFIYFKEETDCDVIADLLHSQQLDFVVGNEGQLTYENILGYNKAYRLIDGLSLSFVVDAHFQVVGIAKKRKHQASIKEQFTKKCPPFLQYIYLEKRTVYWIVDEERLLQFNNGYWKLIDYVMIAEVLKKCLRHFQWYPAHIQELIDLFRTLSQENIGALFVFIDENYLLNEAENHFQKIEDDQILHYLLSAENEQNIATVQLFKNILPAPSKIENIDKYLLKLLAEVDGAVIVNAQLELVDFARMIETQNLNEQQLAKIHYKEEDSSTHYCTYVEDALQNPKDGGARALAAFNASTFGTSIKVSSDGGVNIYYRRKLIYSI